ncbi:nitroreductase [Candidatus Bathyarchaeota archaeon]|nr:MAG: nitroreductase [Candidatus Bathyarchaeota archaeon]
MNIYEVMRTRRSIRAYRPDPIPEEVLNRVLEAVRIAPSGSNRQPWRFILVKDGELRRRLAAACGDQAFIAEAPVVVVACGYDINYNRGGYMGRMSMLVDVSIAFTHLILAARAEGLGTCWIGAFNNDEVKKLLKIPEDVDVVAVTPLGYPRDKGFAEPGPRKALNEIVSIDTFQQG